MTGSGCFIAYILRGIKLQSSVVILLILFSGLSQVYAEPFKLPLDGVWKIRAADNPEYAEPGFDDTGWDRIKLPGVLYPYLMEKKSEPRGIVWLRKTVIIDDSLKGGPLGITPGIIANADNTYFNGIHIGSTGRFPPDEQSMWNHQRYYYIPDTIIRYGAENTISIRVSCFIFCEVRGRMLLSEIDTWDRMKNFDRAAGILLYMVMAVCGSLGLIFFLIWIRRREWREYLYFVLQLVPGFLVLYETCGFIWPPGFDILMRIKVLGFSWTSLVLFQLLFLHRLYGLKRKKTEILLWLIFFVNSVLIVYAHDPVRHRVIGLFVIASITPLALYNISIHLEQFLKKNRIAAILLVPGIVISLGAAHDGIVYLHRFGVAVPGFPGYRFDTLVFGYAAFMMFVGAAGVLVYRFLNTMDKIEDINSCLEERVRERTMELEKSLNNLNNFINNTYMHNKIKRGASGSSPVSQASEGKIRQALVYLNENYMYDISREGLGAWLEINPDYLGKIFKKYTGKKISDYINELRIKKAAVLLMESEDTVIDIAFAAGFESLRTFNRAFLRFMNVSPGVYRELAKRRNK